MSSREPIVGIDLGTTMSAVGVFVDGKPKLLPNELGELLTPSVVAVEGSPRRVLVGRPAKDVLALRPAQATHSFKRAMGTDTTFELNQEKFSPVELSAYVLDALRADAERALECAVRRCVVTVPAYFNEHQRQATRQAAELAGMHVERILNEPTAAALAYGLHTRQSGTRFMVFDLGGGTFDVCVMELFEGLLEVRGVAGIHQLGGEDFTQALEKLVLHKAGVDGATLSLNERAVLHKRAELLKRSLTQWPEAQLELPQHGPVPVTRQEADTVFQPLLEQMRRPCRVALEAAGLTVADLDTIILVGGATRMPCLQKFVAESVGTARILAEPDLVVAWGAAIQAGLCAEDPALGDYVVTDVASHSLGIATARFVGTQHVGLTFTPIIERNSVLPTARTQQFGTVVPNQREVRVQIFEGEMRQPEQNLKLGEIDIDDLPRGPPREVIDVTFTYDVNGMLEVEVQVLGTQTKKRVLFDRREGAALSPQAFERAQERLRFLKKNPSERLRYRDLVARAELLWSEHEEPTRRALGFLIDNFAAALATRTPEHMEAAYHMLLRACEQLDGGERW